MESDTPYIGSMSYYIDRYEQSEKRNKELRARVGELESELHAARAMNAVLEKHAVFLEQRNK